MFQGLVRGKEAAPPITLQGGVDGLGEVLVGFVLSAYLTPGSVVVTHHVSGTIQVVEGCPWEILIGTQGLKLS